MPILHGIKLEIISRATLEIFPEFPCTHSSRLASVNTAEAKLGSKLECPVAFSLAGSREDFLPDNGKSTSVYIPSLPNTRFMVRYHILEGAPEAVPFYYFKLFMNGREITSWGCSARTATTGRISRALFDPSDAWTYEDDHGQIYKRCGLEPRAFYFTRHDPSLSPATDGGLIQVRVFRSRGRQRRIQEPGTYKNQEIYGIALNSNGLLDEPQGAKFYDYHLDDPKDKPYMTFEFHYRSWDSLTSLNLIPESPSRKLLPMTPSLQDIYGLSQKMQEELHEENFTPHNYRRDHIAYHLRDSLALDRQRLSFHRDKIVQYHSDSSSNDSDRYEFERGTTKSIDLSSRRLPNLADRPQTPLNGNKEYNRNSVEAGNHKRTSVKRAFSFLKQRFSKDKIKSTPVEDAAGVPETNPMKFPMESSKLLASYGPIDDATYLKFSRIELRESMTRESLQPSFEDPTAEVGSAQNSKPLPQPPVRTSLLIYPRPLAGPFRSGYGKGKPGFATSRAQIRLPTISSLNSYEDEDQDEDPAATLFSKASFQQQDQLEDSAGDISNSDDSTSLPTPKSHFEQESHARHLRLPSHGVKDNNMCTSVSNLALVSKLNLSQHEQESSTEPLHKIDEDDARPHKATVSPVRIERDRDLSRQSENIPIGSLPGSDNTKVQDSQLSMLDPSKYIHEAQSMKPDTCPIESTNFTPQALHHGPDLVRNHRTDNNTARTQCVNYEGLKERGEDENASTDCSPQKPEAQHKRKRVLAEADRLKQSQWEEKLARKLTNLV